VYERFLVAIDHSESTPRVLEAVKSLGKRTGAEVVVLHLREHEMLGREGPLATEQVGEAHVDVDEAVAELTAAGLKAEGVVLETIWGHAAREIVETAKERDASVIVMGSRGNSELTSLIVGSTAHKVLHLTDRPVLIIR